MYNGEPIGCVPRAGGKNVQAARAKKEEQEKAAKAAEAAEEGK